MPRALPRATRKDFMTPTPSFHNRPLDTSPLPPSSKARAWVTRSTMYYPHPHNVGSNQISRENLEGIPDPLFQVPVPTLCMDKLAVLL
eukprot:757955-Hanusia_phi.AAC.6